MKRRLVRMALALGQLAALVLLVFAVYAWRVAHSPFLTDLAVRGAAYSCIGATLDPARPDDRLGGYLATRYLLDSGPSHPFAGWHVRRALATLAIDAAFTETEVNRMAASTRLSRFRGFDDVALAKTGRRFCELGEAGRAAVRRYYRGPSEARLRAVAEAAPDRV